MMHCLIRSRRNGRAETGRSVDTEREDEEPYVSVRRTGAGSSSLRRSVLTVIEMRGERRERKRGEGARIRGGFRAGVPVTESKD